MTGNAADDTVEADASHHPLLIRILSKEMNVERKFFFLTISIFHNQNHILASQIRDFELAVYDTQKSTIGGACNEFIFSPRLDNLEMSFCAIKALIAAQDIDNDTNIRIAALFDNEEIGSQTAHGADSNLLPVTLQRLANTEVIHATKEISSTAFEEAIHKSILVSADMAHAIHPNYSEKHEENHRPEMHKGTVIKVNANQRYATTAVTSLVLKELAKKHNIPIQVKKEKNIQYCTVY